MTMRKVPAGGMWVPYPINLKSSTASRSDEFYISETEGRTKVSYTFTCPVSGELSMFEFYWNATVDISSTVKVSFQDLDSSGMPDGAADEYRIVTVSSFPTWVQPGIMSSDGTDGGAKRTVTRGQRLACVVEFVTVESGDYIEFGMIDLSDDSVKSSSDGYSSYDGASWNRLDLPGIGMAALQYNTGQMYNSISSLIPSDGFDIETVNSGTSPDEVGLQFSFPTPVRIGGATMCLSTTTDGAAFDCVVYDQTNTAIETVPMKLRTGLFPASGYNYWTALFSTDIFVPGNEVFKVTVKPSSATSVSLLGLGFFDTVFMGMYGYVDTGLNEHFWQTCVRTNDGTFSTLDSVPLISLHVTGIDMDAGGATDDWTGDA